MSTSTALSIIPFSPSVPPFSIFFSFSCIPLVAGDRPCSLFPCPPSPLPPHARPPLSHRCQFATDGIERSILHLAASLDLWFEWSQSGGTRFHAASETRGELTEPPCRRITCRWPLCAWHSFPWYLLALAPGSRIGRPFCRTVCLADTTFRIPADPVCDLNAGHVLLENAHSASYFCACSGLPDAWWFWSSPGGQVIWIYSRTSTIRISVIRRIDYRQTERVTHL